MSVRTYGDKPIAFQLEDNGEYYCVGSEVSTTGKYSKIVYHCEGYTCSSLLDSKSVTVTLC